MDEVEDKEESEAGESPQDGPVGASRTREEAEASAERARQMSEDATAGARRAERMQKTARAARASLEALQAWEGGGQERAREAEREHGAGRSC